MSDFADTRVNLRGRGSIVGTAITALNSAGGIITVDIGGQQVNAQVARNIVPGTTPIANGDLVSVSRHGSTYYVVGILGSATLDLSTSTSDAAPDVRPSYVTGQLVIYPTETATYKAVYGWRSDTGDLYQGDISGTGRMTGTAFYGGDPSSLLGTTVTRATVMVKRASAGDYTAASATLKLVTETSRPSGAPTLTGSLALPALLIDDEAEVDIGTTWGQGLVNGTYGGLAIDIAADTPYISLAGRDTWAAGMALVIDWRRDG